MLAGLGSRLTRPREASRYRTRIGREEVPIQDIEELFQDSPVVEIEDIESFDNPVQGTPETRVTDCATSFSPESEGLNGQYWDHGGQAPRVPPI